MYGISIGLITGSIFAQSIKNLTTNQSSTLTYQRASNLKRCRKVLKTLRASANLYHQRQTTQSESDKEHKQIKGLPQNHLRGR